MKVALAVGIPPKDHTGWVRREGLVAGIAGRMGSRGSGQQMEPVLGVDSPLVVGHATTSEREQPAVVCCLEGRPFALQA